MCCDIHEYLSSVLGSFISLSSHDILLFIYLCVAKYDGRMGQNGDTKAQCPDSTGNDITENILQRLQCSAVQC